MRKILICTSTYLPGVNGGGPIKSIKEMVDALANDFDFYVLTQNRDFNSTVSYDGIIKDKWAYLDREKVKYLEPIQYNSLKKLKKEIQNFEILYLDQIFALSTIKILLLNKFYRMNKKIIVSTRGSLARSAITSSNKKHIKKMVFIYLSKILRLYNECFWHATTSQELKEIKNHFSFAKVFLCQNLKKLEIIPKHKNKEKNILRLVYIARIHHIKNLKFFIEVLEKLKLEKNQKIELDIYGPIEEKEYWEECLNIIKKLNKKDYSIKYKGIIKSDEVKIIFNNYDFSILPTLGENFGHSIIESLLASTPVIISNNTPWKELENYNVGYDISLDNTNKWIEVIKKILICSNKEYKQKVESIENYIFNVTDIKKNKQIMKMELKKIISL